MSAKKENATIFGVGIAACAACCTGPILGVLAAIGVGTAAGFALIGTAAVMIGAAAVAFVVVRRRRRANECRPVEPEAVPVDIGRRDEALVTPRLSAHHARPSSW